MSGAAGTAFGQGQPQMRQPPMQYPATATVEFVGGEIGLAATVRGAPYSAEGVTTISQTLGDGTRIERRTTAKVYRDSEGRVRREQTVLGLDLLKSSGEGQPIITISDPINAETWVLDSASRTARRNRAGLQWSAARGGDVPPPPPPPPPPPGAPGGMTAGVRVERRAFNDANPPESLGTRQIEGVSAEGVRSTTTIPAGEIGNLNPIQLVTERWFSKELQMAVLITRKDPRSGDTTYRLTNVVRNEPPPDLFTVPSDYRIVDLNKVRMDDMKKEVEKLRKAFEAQQQR